MLTICVISLEGNSLESALAVALSKHYFEVLHIDISLFVQVFTHISYPPRTLIQASHYSSLKEGVYICFCSSGQIVFKSGETLRSSLTEVKNTIPISIKSFIVYSIPCSYGKVYIGESTRMLEQRVKEHQGVCKRGEEKNLSTNFCWERGSSCIVHLSLSTKFTGENLNFEPFYTQNVPILTVEFGHHILHTACKYYGET